MALWLTLSTDYFLHSSPDEIAWQTEAVLGAEGEGQQRTLVLVQRQTARGSTAIFVCTPDRDNLFAHTTAILSQLALNVVEARIQTAGSGCTMNTFLVLEEDGAVVSGARREAEIVGTLTAALSNPAAFEPALPRRLPRRIRHFEGPTRAHFAHDPTNQRTVLYLTTTDRPGLLSLVGQAFALCGVRLISAKIATVGALAEDTFFITDRQDRPLDDPSQRDCIVAALRERLDGAGAAG